MSEGIWIGALAVLHHRQQRIADAEDGLLEALAIHRAVGNRGSEGEHLSVLAEVYRDTGRFSDAEQALRDSAAILHESRTVLVAGKTLRVLASLLRDTKPSDPTALREADELDARADEIDPPKPPAA